MAVDDVAQSLIDIHDPGVRARVVANDFSSLGSGLTDEERDLVRQAAADEPEVETFDIMASSYYPALSYIAVNRILLSAPVRVNFNSFFQNRYGSSWQLVLMG
jgi:hypothetical protein